MGDTDAVADAELALPDPRDSRLGPRRRAGEGRRHRAALNPRRASLPTNRRAQPPRCGLNKTGFCFKDSDTLTDACDNPSHSAHNNRMATIPSRCAHGNRMATTAISSRGSPF